MSVPPPRPGPPPDWSPFELQLAIEEWRKLTDEERLELDDYLDDVRLPAGRNVARRLLKAASAGGVDGCR